MFKFFEAIEKVEKYAFLKLASAYPSTAQTKRYTMFLDDENGAIVFFTNEFLAYLQEAIESSSLSEDEFEIEIQEALEDGSSYTVEPTGVVRELIFSYRTIEEMSQSIWRYARSDDELDMLEEDFGYYVHFME